MTGIWLLCISSPRCIQQSPLKFLYLIFVSLSLPVFYSFIGLANIPHLYSRSEEESRSQGKKAKLSQTPSHHQIVTSISVGHTALPLAAREPGELGKTDWEVYVGWIIFTDAEVSKNDDRGSGRERQSLWPKCSVNEVRIYRWQWQGDRVWFNVRKPGVLWRREKDSFPPPAGQVEWVVWEGKGPILGETTLEVVSAGVSRVSKRAGRWR